MPDSKPAPLDEPGRRSGEGVDSLLRHVQRQTKAQLKVPIKKHPEGTEGPDTQPPEP